MAQQVAVCLAGRVFSLPLAPSPGFSLQPMSVSVYMLWPLDFFVDAQDLATAKVTVTIETAPDLCPRRCLLPVVVKGYNFLAP